MLTERQSAKLKRNIICNVHATQLPILRLPFVFLSNILTLKRLQVDTTYERVFKVLLQRPDNQKFFLSLCQGFAWRQRSHDDDRLSFAVR